MSQARDLVKNVEKLKTLRKTLQDLVNRKVRSLVINLKDSTISAQNSTYASTYSEDYLFVTQDLLKHLIHKLEAQIPFTIVEDPPLKKAVKKATLKDLEKDMLEEDDDEDEEDWGDDPDDNDEEFEDGDDSGFH